MKKRMIAGVLSCLLLCGMLVGCSGGSNTSSVEQTDKYEPGLCTVTKFTSEWMGLQYNLPQDVTMATRAQRVTAMQLNKDLHFDNDEDLQKYLKAADYKVICEMLASKDDGTTNIALLVEKIDSSSFSTETYLDAVKQGLQSTSDSVTFGTESKRDIGGQEFLELPYVVTVSKNGFAKTEKRTFFCKLQDNRAICMTLTYNDEAGLEDLLSGFSAL